MHGQRSDLIKGGVLTREATQPFLVHAACVTKTTRGTKQRPASVTTNQGTAQTLTRCNSKHRGTASVFTTTCADTFTNARQGYDFGSVYSDAAMRLWRQRGGQRMGEKHSSYKTSARNAANATAHTPYASIVVHHTAFLFALLAS